PRQSAIEVNPCSLVARLYLHLPHISLVGKTRREARREWIKEKKGEQGRAGTPETRIEAENGIDGQTGGTCAHHNPPQGETRARGLRIRFGRRVGIFDFGACLLAHSKC